MISPLNYGFWFKLDCNKTDTGGNLCTLDEFVSCCRGKPLYTWWVCIMLQGETLVHLLSLYHVAGGNLCTLAEIVSCCRGKPLYPCWVCIMLQGETLVPLPSLYHVASNIALFEDLKHVLSILHVVFCLEIFKIYKFFLIFYFCRFLFAKNCRTS